MKKEIETLFGKKLVERIWEGEETAVTEVIQKIKRLNEIDYNNFYVEAPRVAEMIWLQYKYAVMLLAASEGEIDGLQLNDSKFDTSEKLIYELAIFWVTSNIADEDFIKETMANIIWAENERRS